ncbi:hypothetical protein BX667DRAFT_507427 [Coemansia mojavensis]|nr:hypothetical protein BX667DRAFT_507427 [Coemansia mojavensis]
MTSSPSMVMVDVPDSCWLFGSSIVLVTSLADPSTYVVMTSTTCDDEDELASDVEWLSDSTLEELVLSDSSVLSSVDVSSVVSEKVSLLVSPLVEVISVNDSAEEMSGLLSIVTDSIGAVDISNEVLGGSDDKPITVNVMASESVNVSESSASVGAVLGGIKIPSSIKLIEGSTQ